MFTSIENEISIPYHFQLYQNFPNPFNPSTIIKFTIPNVESRNASALQHVTLKIYDILGRVVSILVNEDKAPGNYEVKFDGTGLPSGIYFYTIKSGSFYSSKKMMLLK